MKQIHIIGINPWARVGQSIHYELFILGSGQHIVIGYLYAYHHEGD